MFATQAIYGTTNRGELQREDLLRWHEQGMHGNVPCMPCWWPQSMTIASSRLPALLPATDEGYADGIWIATCMCWPNIVPGWLRLASYANQQLLGLSADCIWAERPLMEQPRWARAVLRCGDMAVRHAFMDVIEGYLAYDASLVLRSVFSLCSHVPRRRRLAWMYYMVALPYLYSS